jgi:formamidopyrimidine-DNA glycosylase
VPELPDVDAACRLVAAHAGRLILDVCGPDASVLRNTSLEEMRDLLRGRRLSGASRHGKWLVVHVGDPSIVIHLGMTGQLRWEPATADRDRFERVTLATDEGQLRFADRRKLGGIWLAPDPGQVDTLLRGLGPDALSADCDELLGRLAARRGRLKSALLDQSLVAGLGNMLSDEILWRAHLHPARRASTLNTSEGRRLCRALRRALNAAVKKGQIPRTPSWLSGQRAATAPRCPRCGAALQWSRINGRSSLWCPACQPEPDSR